MLNSQLSPTQPGAPLLARLASGEATVNQLTAPFEMTQPAISQHLKVLEDAGLIVTRVEGTRPSTSTCKCGR